MNRQDPALPIALILAGGGGERLGGARKQDLRLGNVSLLARLQARLARQCGTTLLSAPLAGQEISGIAATLPDATDGPSGPVAGLLAGARWIAERDPGALMLVAPVDTPLFPLDFADRARAAMSPDTACAIGGFGSDLYPTCGLWRPQALLEALAGASAGARGPSLRSVARALGAQVLDYAVSDSRNPFAGINTLSELIAMARRLAAHAD